MKGNITALILGLVFSTQLAAQKLPLFDNDEMLAMVDRGGDYIYSEKYDSATMVIDSIHVLLPSHPIVYMMRAMNLAWQDQPVRTTRPIFQEHLVYLDSTVMAAQKLLEKNPNDIEALFFEMSVHGLKAEYYAREGSYLKAMGQAQKTYSMLRITIEKTSRSPEFYFLAGLYNYFREKYPERHPVYKPFLWFYKSGDKERGLIQLDSAVYHSKVVKIEAALYLSYIYLRYEQKPDVALKYLRQMHEEYPLNSYFKTKYIECLFLQEHYEIALPLVQGMVDHEKPYYQLCGLTYQAIYFEKVLNSASQAEKYYELALEKGKESPDRGEYYKSLGYLGLGRVFLGKGENDLAESNFNLAIELDESPKVTAEAEQYLEVLDNQ
ncbi:MAG: hypothetical protein JXR07_16960 [Reichenbachiella sp.]